jgi:hypothetical protein
MMHEEEVVTFVSKITMTGSGIQLYNFLTQVGQKQKQKLVMPVQQCQVIIKPI